MHRSVFFFLLVCGAALVGGVRELGATVLVPAEFHEIVAGSQIIVYGRVLAIRAEWSDDRSRIESIVTVSAGTYLKGGPGSTVTLRVPGGQIGRYRNVMIGAPQFQAGDEAVFFLTASGASVAHIFGLNQGLYRVRVDPQTGQRLVVLPVLMSEGDQPRTVVRGDPVRRQLSLNDFAATVRQAMSPGSAR
jgi:hypothetical protein